MWSGSGDVSLSSGRRIGFFFGSTLFGVAFLGHSQFLQLWRQNWLAAPWFPGEPAVAEIPHLNPRG